MKTTRTSSSHKDRHKKKKNFSLLSLFLTFTILSLLSTCVHEELLLSFFHHSNAQSLISLIFVFQVPTLFHSQEPLWSCCCWCFCHAVHLHSSAVIRKEKAWWSEIHREKRQKERHESHAEKRSGFIFRRLSALTLSWSDFRLMCGKIYLWGNDTKWPEEMMITHLRRDSKG